MPSFHEKLKESRKRPGHVRPRLPSLPIPASQVRDKELKAKLAALNEQDLLCRSFGKCTEGDPIDREVGDLIGKRGPLSPKLFTYARYNAELSRQGLDALGLPDVDPSKVQQLDSVEFIGDLQEVGKAVAAKVKPEHFDGF